MNLSMFINHLVREGQLSAVSDIASFTPPDLQNTHVILREYYDSDIQEMAADTPAFDAEAAMWAAQYIYRIAQLAGLKERNNIAGWLKPYTGALTPDSIYSADLCLRYLPDLVSICKGLPPDDPLLQQIRETARQWAFSSPGMNLPASGSIAAIVASPSLLQAYADRIIATRDINRCNTPDIQRIVDASLGDYASILWPDYVKAGL